MWRKFLFNCPIITINGHSSPFSVRRVNFWIHAVLIKLLPCFILTLISFVLIRVLYKASKRKIKLKGYSYQPTNDQGNGNGTITGGIAALNGNKKWVISQSGVWVVHFVAKSIVAKSTPPPLFNYPLRPPRTDRRTDRTTMLLVAVLLLFLITEFPQGILGLLSAIMHKCFLIRCYSLFGELMDLLALINAAVGFVLYGLMSKQFRTGFTALFLRRRPPPIEMTKVTGVTTTCVWLRRSLAWNCFLVSPRTHSIVHRSGVAAAGEEDRQDIVEHEFNSKVIAHVWSNLIQINFIHSLPYLYVGSLFNQRIYNKEECCSV